MARPPLSVGGLTIREVEVMANPAVVFGGPSPEQDISVLTGLQAARLLAEAGADPVVLYWSKAGACYRAAADGEADDYASGIPPKARELRFEARPQGGWFLKRPRLDVDTVLVCCHGGPGEDGTLQGGQDLAGSAREHGQRIVARCHP